MRWLLLICCLIFSGGVVAQSSAPAIIGLRDDRLLLMQGAGSQILADGERYTPLQAGPGLLYQIGSDDDPRLMYWDGVQHFELTTNYIAGCPPTFTPDGEAVYYIQQEPVVDIFEADPVPREQHWIVRHALRADAHPESFALIELNVSGGGGDGPLVPMEILFYEEYGVWGYPSIFGVTPFGAIYRSSLGCFGGLRLSRNAVTTDLRGHKITVSPDGSQAAVVSFQDDHITIIELSTLVMREVDISPLIVRHDFDLHWAEDNAIYYVVTEQFDSSYGVSREQMRQLTADLNIYLEEDHNSSIYRLDPQTGEQQLMISALHVWTLTRLRSANGYLYFSSIPNGQALVDAFLAGEITGEENFTDYMRYVLPDVYRVPLGGGAVELIQRDVRQYLPYGG